MFDIITTEQDLTAFVDKIKSTQWLAIDTEFLREKTYYAKLCLIQVEDDAGTRACIDPLSIDDLTAFTALLHNPMITKVLHAAHQDLEILFQLTSKVPAPIFDSQTAASVLGIGDQMGYARLVENMLNISLAKTQSRTDWSKRPLRQAQLEYAIDDVRYLAQIYPKMREKLKLQKRDTWLALDFAKATNPATYAIDARERWKKVKGSQTLKRPQLAVLREFAAWREELAEQKNRPRKWILSDEILLDMSRQQPTNAIEIGEIRGINVERTQKYHETWLELLEKGKSVSEENLPELTRAQKPSANQNTLTDLLMLVIQIQAKHNQITPSVIATRKRVVDMVIKGENKISDDWRGALVNDEIAAVIAGELFVGKENNKVTLIKAN